MPGLSVINKRDKNWNGAEELALPRLMIAMRRRSSPAGPLASAVMEMTWAVLSKKLLFAPACPEMAGRGARWGRRAWGRVAGWVQAHMREGGREQSRRHVNHIAKVAEIGEGLAGRAVRQPGAPVGCKQRLCVLFGNRRCCARR